MGVIEEDFDVVDGFINEKLDAHAKEIFGDVPDQKKFSLAFTVDDELVGAANGVLAQQNFHLKGLAVIAACRGNGYGSQLVVEIEKRALAAGAKVLTVSTQCFQALDFYRMHGYAVFAELADVPFEGVTKYYLVKRV
ncbi:MAG: GNAT family N-acetyltransferase [Turicibacter sp.]|nr:GNAT family N-acetyltransferase [Turicibacter sp.]